MGAVHTDAVASYPPGTAVGDLLTFIAQATGEPDALALFHEPRSEFWAVVAGDQPFFEGESSDECRDFLLGVIAGGMFFGHIRGVWGGRTREETRRSLTQQPLPPYLDPVMVAEWLRQNPSRDDDPPAGRDG